MRGFYHRSWFVLLLLLLTACAAPLSSDTGVASNPGLASSPTPPATLEPSSTPLPPTATQEPATATPTSPPTATPEPTELPPLIALDPGHGGRDLGAVRVTTSGGLDLAESHVNLDLALRTRDALIARGYRVFMTREGDYGLNADGLDVNGDGVVDHIDDLQLRIDAVNAAGADLLLSIHQNAFEWPDGRRGHDVGGAMTFYNAYRSFSDDNRRLARLVQQEVVAALQGVGYDVNDRGARVDHQLEVDPDGGRFLVLLGPESARIARPSSMPGVLSEPLFMTHDRELELLKDPAVLDALAVAYADAIDRYFQGDDGLERERE